MGITSTCNNNNNNNNNKINLLFFINTNLQILHRIFKVGIPRCKTNGHVIADIQYGQLDTV